ncbi:MAG: NAD-dependent succinate-semialdehyde dehydrogenase [Candidatus Marinimicrobia bacterium]|mgnify:CR=1 FL=1|jgi:succinate-semialdehyde dehydrogenase/glutarate-semialdehyde dehydrogenase|nr:NAD-dependent succinate-semialdehyde dehydrogenase [Candidatus Neomarinimicrobiota bacterium]MDP6726754.1 NAD-dependent succinate-semialdehyde dehydrogenase [Candidatus Neomarinimicrobiota bacterium]|tara:strand:+ start:667 stop:2031 length:1365 start_codon:yes stop_codon:yes gene_type:complete
MLNSINPSNGELIASYEEMTKEEVKVIISDVNSAYQKWRLTSFSHRAQLMKNAAEILQDRKEDLGRLMTFEMGKPFSQAVAEANKCASVCEYYADNAEKILENQIIETDASKSYVAYRPIGIVLAVMPWNFPFWQVLRFAAPALMAGNVGVLKHASNVQGCALEIEKIFQDAGFPMNVFRTLVIGSKDVKEVIENPYVKAVTLTGSTPAGKAVASQAGAVLKKTVLELGGSDPYIILEDADLDQAITACMIGRFLNTGQSCIAAKRFIVVESILDEFRTKLLEAMKTQKWGDPFDEDVNIGPMVNILSRDEVHEQVTASIEKGADLLVGGIIPDVEGAFYPATLLDNVRPGMPAFDDEIFGPVASIIPVKDEEEAIRLANQTPFGLGGAVFTKNVERGERIAANDIEAGSCFVNDFVRSDPRLPFGGIKESGYGRELSEAGIREFTNMKTVYIR